MYGNLGFLLHFLINLKLTEISRVHTHTHTSVHAHIITFESLSPRPCGFPAAQITMQDSLPRVPYTRHTPRNPRLA